MPYATEQDIADSYGSARLDMLADIGAGTRDDAKIARALDGASATIDGYISQRYALPLPSTPAVLRQACIDIAVYRLASDATLLTDDIRQRYEDAIAFLKDVAKAVAALGLPTRADQASGATDAASPQTVLVDADPRVFSRQSLRRM
jgi:phage gp36-like protein